MTDYIERRVRAGARTLGTIGCAVSTISALAAFAGAADTSPKTRAHVQALASEKLEGRLAGSAGERLAADYIFAELQEIGAKPLPGQRDYRLPFEFTAGTKDGGSTVRVRLSPDTATRTFDPQR